MKYCCIVYMCIFFNSLFYRQPQIHWGHHPLRPEFLESTYFLYRATGDHYYLHVGKNVLKSLQSYARVPCGYASFEDVRTGTHEDRCVSVGPDFCRFHHEF